jgi:hypothetical protein
VDFLDTSGSEKGAVGYGLPAGASPWAGNIYLSTPDTTTPIILVTNLKERVRIDTAGNVGIGTPSPPDTLSVYATDANPVVHIENIKSTAKRTAALVVANYGGAVGSGIPYILLQSSRGSNTAPSPSILNDTIGEIHFYGMGTTIFQKAASIISTAQSTFSDANFSGNLLFATASGGDIQTRMTITSTGSVGIGVPNPSYKLDLAGDVNVSDCVRASGSNIGGTCSSDERLKTDIQPFDLGLDALLGISPHFFKYNGLGGHPASQKPELGVIAQELEKTAPQLVVTKNVKLNPDDLQTTEIKQVNYTAFTYILINAVRDLYHRWFDDSETIHREIASIKADNAAKDKEIVQLKVEIAKQKQENADFKAYLCGKDPGSAICR